MTRLFSIVFLVLLLAPACAIEHSNLSDAEIASLTAVAAKISGIGVWQIRGSAIRQDSGVGALARVVFDPADYSGFCLAPSAQFTAESLDSEVVDWHLLEGDIPQYWFWYQPCNSIDARRPIVLRQIVDVGVLERISDQKYLIVRDAIRQLSPDHTYDIPDAKHRLREVQVRFDHEFGVVYQLQFGGTDCRGISTDVVIDPRQIKVISSTEWLC